MERVMGNTGIFMRVGGRMDALLVKGGIVPWHVHENFGHVTDVTIGGVLAEMKNPEGVTIMQREVWAPHSLVINAGYAHQFTSLVDGTIVRCIWAHRHPSGEPSQEYTGWHEAYR